MNALFAKQDNKSATQQKNLKRQKYFILFFIYILFNKLCILEMPEWHKQEESASQMFLSMAIFRSKQTVNYPFKEKRIRLAFYHVDFMIFYSPVLSTGTSHFQSNISSSHCLCIAFPSKNKSKNFFQC